MFKGLKLIEIILRKGGGGGRGGEKFRTNLNRDKSALGTEPERDIILDVYTCIRILTPVDPDTMGRFVQRKTLDSRVYKVATKEYDQSRYPPSASRFDN